jgi:glutamate-1-semialdehyde 2,1-aminomutase
MLGAGLPIGLIGGRRDVLELCDASKVAVSVPIGGTLSGHHISVAAGLAQLKLLTEDVFAKLHRLGDRLRDGVRMIAAEEGVPLQVTGIGHLSHLHWSNSPITTYDSHVACDHGRLHAMDAVVAERGFFVLVDGRTHLTAAMTEHDVDAYLDAVREAARKAA